MWQRQFPTPLLFCGPDIDRDYPNGRCAMLLSNYQLVSAELLKQHPMKTLCQAEHWQWKQFTNSGA